MAKALFEVGTKAEFESLRVKDDKVMYWITDTQELYRGNTLYAVGKEATETSAGLLSAEDKQLLESLKSALVDNNIGAVINGDSGIAVANATYASPDIDGVASPAIMDMGAVPAVMDMAEFEGQIAAYDGWENDKNNYPYYDCYNDDAYSYIDENKNIILDKGQINITEESYAQFIPFEMKRYYDGIDLSKMKISLYYVTKDGYDSEGEIVNVKYGADVIRFAWLLDDKVTHIAGDVRFEVKAIGYVQDEKGNSRAYLWKSKTGSGINVTQSLFSNGKIKLDDSWIEILVTQVVEKVAQELIDTNIEENVTKAQEAADRAENAAIHAADEARNAATTAVQEALVDYSTTNEMKHFVAEAIEDANIDDKLTEYAKTAEVKDLVGNLGSSKTVVEYVNNTMDTRLGSLVDENNQQLTVEDYVNKKVEEVDISDQIGDLGTDNEGNPITSVVDYVNKKVEEVDVSDQLENYYTKDETYDKNVIDDKIKNVQVDLSDYVTTNQLKALETSLETVSNNTVTNAQNIVSVQNEVKTIQDTLNLLEGDNKNLIIQYNEVGSILHLYERDENGDIIITDGEEQIKVKEIYSTVITGGGGGSQLVSTIKLGLRPDGEDSFTVLYGNDTSLNYNLSTRKAKEIQDEDGKDITVYEEAVIAGDITLTLYRDNVYQTHFTVTKTSANIQSGSIDVSDYVVLGNQVFTVTASYVEQLGADGESVTIRSSADWAVNAVNLKLTNLPDSTWESTPKYGSTAFLYTPIGALEKTIYFKIDDEEPETVVTSLNGTALTYIIPQQSHGVHTLEVWCEGNVGDTIISTEKYKYVLMFVEEGNNEPIIRIKAPAVLEQYSSDYIYYNVLDPLNSIINSVTIYDEDGVVLSSVQNITSAEQKWEFRPTIVKDKTITIKYKDTEESVVIEVTKFPYEINAVTDGLMVDFVPTGRTNSDVDYDVFRNNAFIIEKDKDTGEETQKEIPITWTLSDNFDWINGGWKIDSNGDTYFCIKSGTHVDINYNLFGTNGVVAKMDANGEYTIAGTGKEFKLIFKTTNVAQANTTWLSCIDVADKKSLGIRMEAQNGYIDSSLGTLEIPYVDDDIIEFDMNIVPVTKFLENGEPNLTVKAIPMVMTYEDGTPVQPKVISSVSTSFKQDSPKPITIGSDYCDVHIYRMKVYERYLDDKEIITNFIADARSGVEMAKRYVKNDIYPVEDKQRITPESVAAACPDLKVYVLSAPHFTNDKNDKVTNTTIKQIHNTGTKEKPEYDASENWTATGATHNGQGTSSNEYGYSGRNLEFNMKKATITLNDNKTVVKNIQLSPTSYPTNYLNFKINIASSENANNALLQKRYDRYLPYTSVASLIDDRKKNSMEFFNCVVFIQETDEDVATHREFSDTDIHFYGIGNIGDSKKTDDTRVNDKNDENEFCVEIMDWNRYLSSFPADTMVSTIYEDAEGVKSLRFEKFLVDSNLGQDGIIYEKDADGNYYHSTDITVDKTKTYYIDILENDDFSEDYTYGFRYIQSEWKEEDGADYKERNEAFQKPLRQKWIEFYRFVTRDLTTNGVEDKEKVSAWKSEFSDWFIVDSALYYYLYTLRYTMVDNRAKNTFWHWGKHYLTFDEAKDRGIAVYDENKNLITDSENLPSKFYDVKGNEIKNINASAAAINNGYRMEFWAYDNDTALGIDNAGKLEIPFGVEDEDVDAAGVPYFRAHDSLVFVRIAKYFVEELESAWHNTEINSIDKVFDSIKFINEFDNWQNQFPEELWRLDYERKYKRTYVGGTGGEWDNALPQSNKSDIKSTRFLTEMMNGRKKYQRRCFERNQEIYMSSKFKGEVNLSDTITLRGTGKPTDKVVTPNFTLNITPFSKMYINLYSATDKIYYHEKCEAGVSKSIAYPETTLDFIYIRGASQIQSLGDLSPMYLQTAELTRGAKMKVVTLGNATTGYSNDSLQTLQIGAGNKMLDTLDIRNLSNFNNTVLPVSNIPSLKRVYAQGSNIAEAVFANNGLLEEAYLPETTTRLELRNLHYLKTISLESYDNLLHLIVLNCSAVMNDIVLDMINQASDLRTLRVTNIDWILNDTSVLERLYNLIINYDQPEVMLSGKIHVPVIREKQYDDYNKIWPDLKITYDEGGLIHQYPVTYVNYDDTELYVQYVDEGGYAFDPEINGDISTPTRESSVSTDYIYSGWDYDFSQQIWKATTIKAKYSEAVRKYTIRYIVAEGDRISVLQESVGDYGTYVYYTGSIPTYTAQESGWRYYLFKGWNKSGLISEGEDGKDFDENGIKTVTAVFDTFRYTDGYFDNKDFSELTPVEIYGMLQMKVYDRYVVTGDTIPLTIGNDCDYSDIKSQVLISEKKEFTGNNYIDTGIKLFDEDRDFVLAIDYQFSKDSKANGVIAQCHSPNGDRGFKVLYDSNIKLKWNDGTATTAKIDKREMLVIRHIKGDNNLYIYGSNAENETNGTIITKYIMQNELEVNHEETIVFGSSKTTDGYYVNYAVGTIYWSKLWYADLGEAICEELAAYPHESFNLIVSNDTTDISDRRFLLADGSNGYSSITFVADKPLSNSLTMVNGTTYSQSWLNSAMNEYLNTKVYKGLPVQWRQLLKKCKIKSLEGSTSKNTVESEGYITIPAASDVFDMKSVNTNNVQYEVFLSEIYPATRPLSLFSTDASRILYNENNDAVYYWTRTPNPEGYSWQCCVSHDGSLKRHESPYTTQSQDRNNIYTRIMLSI